MAVPSSLTAPTALRACRPHVAVLHTCPPLCTQPETHCNAPIPPHAAGRHALQHVPQSCTGPVPAGPRTAPARRRSSAGARGLGADTAPRRRNAGRLPCACRYRGTAGRALRLQMPSRRTHPSLSHTRVRVAWPQTPSLCTPHTPPLVQAPASPCLPDALHGFLASYAHPPRLRPTHTCRL